MKSALRRALGAALVEGVEHVVEGEAPVEALVARGVRQGAGLALDAHAALGVALLLPRIERPQPHGHVHRLRHGWGGMMDGGYGRGRTRRSGLMG